MSTLDNPNTTISTPPSIWPTVFRYGLIGGLVFIVYSLIGIVTGFTSPGAGFGMIILNFFISLLLYVGIMVMAIRYYRDNESGGYITFGKAFGIGLAVALVVGILTSIFTYLYATVIDPDYFGTVLEETQGLYERMGMSEEQIEELMEQARNTMTPNRLVLQSLITNLIFGAIVAAIVGAVMKRTPAV